MSVFDRFGLNFDTTRFGDAHNLSSDASNTMNLIASTSGKFSDWQISSLEAGPIERTEYFQNPTATNIISILSSADLISVTANTCNLFSLQAAADNLTIELNKFLSHTDNISGIVTVTDQSVPSYDTAISFGQMSMMNLSKSNESQSNTDVMLGCFTSLFISDIIEANANTLIYYSNKLADSVTANTDNVENITYSSNLSIMELANIENYCISTGDILNIRRTQDWSFYQNTLQISRDAGFLQQFNNMGGTQSYLVKNIIGTPTLVQNLTANTTNT